MEEAKAEQEELKKRNLHDFLALTTLNVGSREVRHRHEINKKRQ